VNECKPLPATRPQNTSRSSEVTTEAATEFAAAAGAAGGGEAARAAALAARRVIAVTALCQVRWWGCAADVCPPAAPKTERLKGVDQKLFRGLIDGDS